MKRIGMIVAVEIKAVLDKYGAALEEKNVAGYRVLEYKTDKYELIILNCGAGEIAAAAGTQYLISEYKVDMIANFGVVGGLILGDFAVQIGWFVPEVIVYMAFVAIANFSQSSYELGYAFKFMRMLLLLAAGIGGLWGFAGGLVLVVVLIATNKTVGGKRRYLYPLIPWNGAAMKRLLLRERLKGARK